MNETWTGEVLPVLFATV